MDIKEFTQRYYLNWIIKHDCHDSAEIIREAEQAWDDIENHFKRLQAEDSYSKLKRNSDKYPLMEAP